MADEADERGFVLTSEMIPRRSPKEITELAREVVLGQRLVTNDPDALQYGFSLLLMGMKIPRSVADQIGAVIGNMDSVLPRSLNGWPMFTSCGFLHVEDVPAFNDEIDRMRAALGIVEGEVTA